MKKQLSFILLTLLTANVSAASFLDDFKGNSRVAFDKIPIKFGARLAPEVLEQKVHACRRDRSRSAIMRAASKSQFFKFGVGANYETLEVDRGSAQDFFDEPVEKNLKSMDRDFKTGASTVRPWSGDFWAIKSGAIAKRYLDPDFINLSGWLESFNYVTVHPASAIDFSLYSPAEKYDRIVGDTNFSLTAANWAEGKRYNDETGDVEGWMGICHGWAPASFMEPRPSHTVDVAAYGPSRETVQLFPDDVKALLTLKWANGISVNAADFRPATRFVGGRCNVKEPKTDPETGRIIEPACFDLNPATWHIIIVNQLGIAKRPLIIDAAYDYEVWNQPVLSYSYKYFNPKTMQEVDSLSKARVKFSDPEFKDKFSSFRKNPRAVQVAGVIMSVTYTIETSPSDSSTDADDQDAHQTVAYHYDLELDDKNEILGGEWYQKRHPDFVWAPEDKSISLNNEDLIIKTDRDVVAMAPLASRENVPLKYVLDGIMKDFGTR